VPFSGVGHEVKRTAEAQIASAIIHRRIRHCPSDGSPTRALGAEKLGRWKPLKHGSESCSAEGREVPQQVASKECRRSFHGPEKVVGAARFELATPCAQGRCATRLRYAPTCEAFLILNHFVSDKPFRNSFSARNCIKTVSKPVHCTFAVSKPFDSLGCRLIFRGPRASSGVSSANIS
jgi:hypothetical protein